ncbi:MAG: tRNA glutamyl-Q(34) synthetase GluQRS [Pedosphaera sp.]|nr:tRNA glutamyl-Q(34) synthetase GluQRS [Pedosphaera sp.]
MKAASHNPPLPVFEQPRAYRGRIAPSPSGYLHIGHARTFWIAYERALASHGTFVLRNEDLDPDRSKPEFAAAMIDDLRWLGIVWQEGPDVGGHFGPYNQSERRSNYARALLTLAAKEFIYPCTCTRNDLAQAVQAPNGGDEEAIYPGTCRCLKASESQRFLDRIASTNTRTQHSILGTGRPPNWRFRIPDSHNISFLDGQFGPQRFIAGRDFGDFVVWRHDNVPAYQLAVVVDDAAMGITEVVRGADLLVSTARQLLLYEALGLQPPEFFHCPLVADEAGVRLAKRHDSLSLRALRAGGVSAETIRNISFTSSKV